MMNLDWGGNGPGGVRSPFAAMVFQMLSELPLGRRLRTRLRLLRLQIDVGHSTNAHVLRRAARSVELGVTTADTTLGRGAVIKAPVRGESGHTIEKGVIMLGFESELDRLVHHRGFDSVCDDFDVLFLPTWQPFYSAALLRFLKKRPDALIVLPSSWQCYFNALQTGDPIEVLPFHASSWVDERLYSPQPAERRDIDILMLANFAPYKRHHLLFRALRDMPRERRVVLIGKPNENRSAADVIAEARRFGVEDRFTLLEGPPDDVVRDHLSRAKLVLGLSRREGSYVALAEALFANASVAVFANAIIGTKNYINPLTGFLLDEKRPLAQQLERSLAATSLQEPREWACRNISAQINSERLERHLRNRALAANRPWTRSIDPFRIQNFRLEPLSGHWSSATADAIECLRRHAIRFQPQIDDQLDATSAPQEEPTPSAADRPAAGH